MGDKLNRKIVKAARQLRSEAAKLDNGEILQSEQTDKNLSTLQPFNHSTNKSYTSKKAFTLAETLITLGVIGIVASLTLPSLIHTYKKHVLKTQFKRSVANLAQAVQFAKINSQIDNFGRYCSTYDANNGGYYNTEECINALVSAYSKKNLRTDKVGRNDIKTYNNKATLYYIDQVAKPVLNQARMSDGTYLGWNIYNGMYMLSLDTNGSKGPNRLGHDIFTFQISPKNDALASYRIPRTEEMTEAQKEKYCDKESASYNRYTCEYNLTNACSLTSTAVGNGFDCSYYALKDICPYTGKNGYFECLPR